MKLISRLLILAIVPMMLLVACGQETAAPAPTQPTDAELAARQAQAAAAEMRQIINRLTQDNQVLTSELNQLQGRAISQSAQLNELIQQASRLEAAATARVSAPADAAPTPAAAERKTSPFTSFLLFIVFLIVALIVIYFIYRALKPRPFEDDEDDDFSSFDDDFGFDDEEDEEGDDEKKDSENK